MRLALNQEIVFLCRPKKTQVEWFLGPKIFGEDLG